MAGENIFKREEFVSDRYTFRDKNKKKIKYFVFSWPFYYRSEYKKCLIEEPTTGVNEDVDVWRMRLEFITLNADDSDVYYGTNLKKEKFLAKLEGMKKDVTLKEYDCFFFMFFTFLDKDTQDKKNVEEELLHCLDGRVSVHEIWERIRDVEQFRGKPKLFFIQSDNLHFLHPDIKIKTTPVDLAPEKIPVDTDRLIIQSAIPAEYAQRFDTGKAVKSASFLIQAFLEVMKENQKHPEEDQFDMLSLCTAIVGKVKEKIKYLKEKNVKFADYLPLPLVSSTLTKFLYLPVIVSDHD